MSPTPHALEALRNLRDPSLFQWYLVPLIIIAIYLYNVEIQQRNWSAVFAGLSLMGMDWLNEIANSLIFHFTQYAPLWGAPSKTAFLILIGLNAEIQFMFLIAGLAAVKLLPADPKARIAGLPNRLVVALGLSALAVFVEVWLNAADALTWDWPFWNAQFFPVIMVFGYLHFFVVAFWVHDMATLRHKAIATGAILGLGALGFVVFGSLGWL